MKNSIIAVVILFSTLTAHAKVKVALVFPQTGKDTDFYCLGNAIAKSADQKLFEFTFFDNENSTSKTVEIAKKIVAGDFDVVVGTRTSQEALVAAKFFDKSKIPFVVPIASHADISKGRSNIIRMVNSSEQYSKLYAKLIATNFKPKRLAVVEDVSAPYSQYYALNTIASLKNLNASIVVSSFKIFEAFKDFSKLSQKISETSPDLVYLPIYSPEALGVFDAFKDYEKPLTFVSHASINDGRQILTGKTSKNSNLKFVFDGIWDGKIGGPYAKEYRALMATCSGYSDSLRTVSSFDSIKLVLSVLGKKPNLRQDELSKALKDEKFVGVMGSRFRERGEPQMPLNLFELNGSKITYLMRYDGK